MPRIVPLALLISLSLAATARAQNEAGGTKTLPGWKVEVVASYPAVRYCSVVCCAPDGRIFLGEDPMDLVGPANKPGDRIMCLHPNGEWTVFAEGLYAVFGMQYLDGKLYVHHCPRFSVFEDGGTVGKNRKDLIETTNPQPWASMNDHIPSGFRLAMDGWFYMSTGDKGIFGAVGTDGSKAEIHGGGILRFRPDGSHLEVYTTGSRNHLDIARTSEDEMFTYDNTDDGLGWNTRFTHMVDGGFYGYPYDYKTRKPYTLWMIKDYGGGSPTGAIGYNEDALPSEYRDNLFMLEWGKGQLARFVVERTGGTFNIAKREDILSRATAGKAQTQFRPVGIDVSMDGMSFYVADWNYNGWAKKMDTKTGQLLKVTWQGENKAAPKPEWFVPASMGQPFKATNEELAKALTHPSERVRFVAMRRLAERGKDAIPLLTKLVGDTKAPAYARWSAIWTLDRMEDGKAGRETIIAALKDADPSVKRQAARQLGTRGAKEAVSTLVPLVQDQDRSVRFWVETALGRIGDGQAVAPLQKALDEDDLFTRYAAFKALSRIGAAQPTNWSAIAAGLASDNARISEYSAFAFRDAYQVAAVDGLASLLKDTSKSEAAHQKALAILADLSRQAPAWNGKWWNTRPAASQPPAKTVAWEGTPLVRSALAVALHDPSLAVRQTASKAMVASNDPESAIALLKYLPSESDAATRKSILGSLAKVRNPGEEFTKAGNELGVEALNNASTDAGFISQTLAFVANLPEITPALTEALVKQSAKEWSAGDLTALLNALGKSKSDLASLTIANHIRNSDVGVRTTVIDLLTSRPGDVAVKTLSVALQDKDLEVRKAAVTALGARQDSSTVPTLLSALKDQEIRFDVISALTNIPDIRAFDAYMEGIGGKNAVQRNAAAKAIGEIKKDALPLIEKRLDQKPALAPDVIAQLQKTFADDDIAKNSRLMKISVKTLALEALTSDTLKLEGNPEHGRQLFFDIKGASCVKCHKVQGEGGDVGPDLRSVGAKYNREQILESILYPSKQILEGYTVTSVETKNGKVMAGIVRSDTEDELTLVDVEGKKIVLKKKDIEALTKSDKSLMPEGLEAGLNAADLADVVSFLLLQKDIPEPAVKKASFLTPIPRWFDAADFGRIGQTPATVVTIELLRSAVVSRRPEAYATRGL